MNRLHVAGAVLWAAGASLGGLVGYGVGYDSAPKPPALTRPLVPECAGEALRRTRVPVLHGKGRGYEDRYTCITEPFEKTEDHDGRASAAFLG